MLITIIVLILVSFVGAISGWLYMAEHPRYTLTRAARDGDVQAISRLLDGGADINEADKSFYGQTPLVAATQWGMVDAVKLLLDKGANPNKKDYSGETALNTSIRNLNGSSGRDGYYIVRLLLDNKADVNLAVNKYGGRGDYTPFMQIDELCATNSELRALFIDVLKKNSRNSSSTNSPPINNSK